MRRLEEHTHGLLLNEHLSSQDQHAAAHGEKWWYLYDTRFDLNSSYPPFFVSTAHSQTLSFAYNVVTKTLRAWLRFYSRCTIASQTHSEHPTRRTRPLTPVPEQEPSSLSQPTELLAFVDNQFQHRFVIFNWQIDFQELCTWLVLVNKQAHFVATQAVVVGWLKD